MSLLCYGPVGQWHRVPLQYCRGIGSCGSVDASLSRVTVRTLSQLRSLALKFRKRYAPLLQSSIYISSSFDCVRSQRPEIIRFSEKRLASLVKLPRLVPHAHSRSCLVMLCMLCAVWELNTTAAPHHQRGGQREHHTRCNEKPDHPPEPWTAEGRMY